MLENPDRLPEDIRHYLETQNRRTEEWLGGTKSRKWIIDELKATIRDRDDSVPISDGVFSYWQRFVEGAEHPDFLRQHQSEKSEVLLSGDMRATNHPYYDIGAADHSPDHRFFAVTEDWQGSERYTLTIFQAGTQEQLEDSLMTAVGILSGILTAPKFSTLVSTRINDRVRFGVMKSAAPRTMIN